MERALCLVLGVVQVILALVQVAAQFAELPYNGVIVILVVSAIMEAFWGGITLLEGEADSFFGMMGCAALSIVAIWQPSVLPFALIVNMIVLAIFAFMNFGPYPDKGPFEERSQA